MPSDPPGADAQGSGAGEPAASVPDNATLAESVTRLLTNASAKTRAKLNATVKLVNRLATSVSGVVTVRLFLSSDSVLDGSDTELAHMSKKLKLKQGRSKLLRIKSPVGDIGAEREMHLFATVQRPDGTMETVEAPS